MSGPKEGKSESRGCQQCGKPFEQCVCHQCPSCKKHHDKCKCHDYSCIWITGMIIALVAIPLLFIAFFMYEAVANISSVRHLLLKQHNVERAEDYLSANFGLSILIIVAIIPAIHLAICANSLMRKMRRKNESHMWFGLFSISLIFLGLLIFSNGVASMIFTSRGTVFAGWVALVAALFGFFAMSCATAAWTRVLYVAASLVALGIGVYFIVIAPGQGYIIAPLISN